MPRTVYPGVDYWTRAEVGLAPFHGENVAKGGKKNARHHHSTGEELGRPDFRAWVREIDRYHREHNGWENGFGYNFAVAIDLHDKQRAHVLEGRGWYGVGAHTEGHNTEGLGIVFLGDDDPGYTDLTPGVKRAIRWVNDEGSRLHGNTLEAIPHSATSQTACPGDERRLWIARGMPISPFPGTEPKPVTKPRPPSHPVYPGHVLFVVSKGHPELVWQRQMIRRGWDLRSDDNRARGVRVGQTGKGDDGVFGRRSATVGEAFAHEKAIPVQRRNGYVVVNRRLWDATWTEPITR